MVKSEVQRPNDLHLIKILPMTFVKNFLNCATLTLLTLFATTLNAQQTVGLFTNEPEAFNGYTLFAPVDNTETYLINNCGEKVHSWSSAYRPGLSCYLMDDGTLLRTGRISGMGGGSGIVEMIDWNGNVIWSHSVIGTHGRQHHDIELLPNGNILLVVWDGRTPAEVTQAGSSTNNNILNSEQIVEIQPDLVNGGATVVWEWKAWDHLIQDVDAGKADYGVVAQHPERIDINFLNHNSSDWLHINGIDYNATLDQIIVSVRSFNEFWIIDHSTTTAEAASSSGGNAGKGGDLLYRWGNPQAYDQGTVSSQQLFFQHHAHWIENGLQDAGKILLFNNQAGDAVGQNYSTVDIINPPVDASGNYTYNGGAYGPTAFDWTYQAPTPTDFFSNIISGVKRLENGNTLICQGVGGRFFEINANDSIVWEYVNPVINTGPVAQGTNISGNNVFRATRYRPNHPGLQGKNLTPQGYLETGSTHSCTVYTDIEVVPNNVGLQIYPNPASTAFMVELSSEMVGDANLKLIDISGKIVWEQLLQDGAQQTRVDAAKLQNGMYFLQVVTGNQTVIQKVIITQH